MTGRKKPEPMRDSDRLKAGELRHFIGRGIDPAEAERLVCITLAEAATITALPADFVPTPDEIKAACAGIQRGWSSAEFVTRLAGCRSRAFERSA